MEKKKDWGIMLQLKIFNDFQSQKGEKNSQYPFNLELQVAPFIKDD